MSLFFMGTQRFLYKVSAERKCNTAWTTFSFMATVALLSSFLFLFLQEPVTDVFFLVFIALVNSASFLAATLTHIESLKRIPSSVAYPIIRLNAVIVVIFSILYFKDRLSFYQVTGIVLAMAVMVLLTRQLDPAQAPSGDLRRGLVFVFVSLLAGAVASISSKFAALHANKLAFIALSYIIATVSSFAVRDRFQTDETNRNHRDALIIGFVMGLINLAGYYSFLKALSMGPLSLIVSITGMHFVIAVILSVIVYREKLTLSRILGIVLTVLSIVLMRL
jgi:drug/metabolite transporter (DMT)-like permease